MSVRPLLPLAALSAAVISSGAIAQTVLQLPDVVVSASLLETPAQQVGSAVTVIDAEHLKNRQVRTVGDALRGVPGVTFSRSGGPGTTSQIRIRGAEANHTLVLIDGVEANDPTYGSSFDFADLPITEIERIEVLRGPQSALWGSDAIGGVINIITRRGEGKLSGYGQIEGGSFNTWNASAGLSGGSDRGDFAIGVSRQDTDGTSVAPHGTEDDGYENTTLNLRGGLEPFNGFSLDASVRYTDAQSQFDPQTYADPTSPDYGRVVDGDELRESEALYGRVAASLDLFDGFWQQRLGASLTDTENQFFTEGVQSTRYDGRKKRLDYRSSFIWGSDTADHDLTFALERESEDYRQRGDSPTSPANQDQSITNTGVVAEYRLGLHERLFLTGAVRHDDNDRFADATTWRATAAYLFPDSGVRLHGSYGTGVTNPSFIELFGFFPDSFIGNPNLKPEKARGWDFGVEFPLFDDRLTMDVTVFHTVLEDEIIATFDSTTFLSSVANGEGESERRGVEISATAELGAGWDLSGSYTYTDAEAPDGQRERRRPQHAVSANLGYAFQTMPARLDLSVVRNSDVKDDDFSTFPASTVTLDGYTLVTLAGRYQVSEQIDVFARVENLLDEDYQDVYDYAQPGRAFYLGVRAEF